MAKVTLPLLGVSAHGMLARQLVYRTRPGGTVASVWKGKRDARSEAQLAQRSKFRDAREMWPYLDAETRAGFAAQAADRHLTAWNQFLKEVLSGAIKEVSVGTSTIGGPDMLWLQ
jgi:hypothetical protein